MLQPLAEIAVFFTFPGEQYFAYHVGTAPAGFLFTQAQWFDSQGPILYSDVSGGVPVLFLLLYRRTIAFLRVEALLPEHLPGAERQEQRPNG